MTADDSRTVPSLPTIALLGAGNMNGAILAGLVRPGEGPADAVRVTTRSAASAERLGAAPRGSVAALEQTPDAHRRAVAGAGIVVIGTKPAMVPAVLAEIADALEPGAVVVSIAAGVETATMAAALPEHARIVRAMPNTPATIGLGVTGIAAGRGADAEAMALARAVFESVGSVAEVDEARMPAISAVSGSGPAYVYLLVERMIEGVEAIGLDAEQAADLVIDNFRGAVEMLRADREAGPAELRRRVPSPGGITERSVAVLEEARLADLFTRAFEANLRRGDALARAAADPAQR